MAQVKKLVLTWEEPQGQGRATSSRSRNGYEDEAGERRRLCAIICRPVLVVVLPNSFLLLSRQSLASANRKKKKEPLEEGTRALFH